MKSQRVSNTVASAAPEGIYRSGSMDLLLQAAKILVESRNIALNLARTEVDLGFTVIGLALVEFRMREPEIAARSIVDASKACDAANQILKRVRNSESDRLTDNLKGRIQELRERIGEVCTITGFDASALQ